MPDPTHQAFKRYFYGGCLTRPPDFCLDLKSDRRYAKNQIDKIESQVALVEEANENLCSMTF